MYMYVYIHIHIIIPKRYLGQKQDILSMFQKNPRNTVITDT